MVSEDTLHPRNPSEENLIPNPNPRIQMKLAYEKPQCQSIT